MVKVSIICLAYNQAQFIEQTIESCLGQTADFAYEILIHDDASTDGTSEIIREYSDKYPKIVKATFETMNQISQGNANFLDDMFKRAEGEYIALCDGDDYWIDNRKLQKQVDYLENNKDCHVCFHPVRIEFVDGSKPNNIYPIPNSSSKEFTINELIRRNYIHTCSVMYRRGAFNKIPTGILPRDWYLHVYFASRGKTIGFMPDVMAVYRRHAGGIWWESQGKMDQLMKAHGIEWLGLYVAMKELFQTEPKRRKIIEGSIITHCHSLAKIDHKYKTQLMEAAATKYPQAMAIFVRSLLVDLENLHRHAKKQADIINHYVELSERLQKERDHIEGMMALRIDRTLRKLSLHKKY